MSHRTRYLGAMSRGQGRLREWGPTNTAAQHNAAGAQANFEPARSAFLDEFELAQRWGMSVKTLRNARQQGTGCLYHKLIGSVRYAITDVIDYERRNKRKSTSGGSHA